MRVVIADDDALLRAGVALVLGSEDGIEVVGEAADGLRAVELCRSAAPDVILMDVRMPGIDGVEATRRIVTSGLPTRVLVLTTFHHDDYVWGALRAGAAGFLLKRASPERLIDAVQTLAGGESVLDPAVTRDLVGQLVTDGPARASSGPRDPRLAQLTAREREVLRQAAEGHSNAQIAELFLIAESTVKTHMKRILAKVDARDRAQAVAIAYRGGLMNAAGEDPR
ncbi:response regulator transcription factor [Streptacidiphilus sp. PB12-B1b]|uniref:response regulator n=1 Tax=Streptacidiphilus sp. PB12-B1b TaxID=2705012 RepID=UPI0015F864F7|nr:response regulator transcription factor [Streptacidiphilus sp. PB12-B1b]QMU80298.1 response regulator transcription factor [Streptacidiphilus sp. PB12-B1b]